MGKTFLTKISIMWMGILFIVFSAFPLVQAQGIRNERNAAGTLINQDYYTADLYPETKFLRTIVEAYHFSTEHLDKIRAGRYQDGLYDLEYTLEKFPNHPGALQVIGSVARLLNIPQLGIAHYKKALSLYPQYAFTHAQYGSYLVDIGKVEEGIAELKQAIKMDPKLAPAYAWLAKAYYKSGQTELGRQAEQQAKELGYKADMPVKTQSMKIQSEEIQSLKIQPEGTPLEKAKSEESKKNKSDQKKKPK
jgi:predicted Zn-dependent protease